jgi:hypothetical protein
VRRLLPALAAIALAGCGGGARHATPPQPKLPRALAQSWKQQADSVATALAAGDCCTAQHLAASLRASVISAVNAHRVPRRFLDPLTSGVNELASQIACTPTPAPAPAPAPAPPPAHGHGHKGKHGKGEGGD